MNCARIIMLLTCLSVPAWQVEAQFIEVTAQIQSIRWLPSETASGVSTVQCVFGKDSWQIREESPRYGKSTYTNWFTGKHLIERSSLAPPVELIPNSPPPTWMEVTNIVASLDGNPSTPRGSEDLMSEEARMAWLAFCSGSYLKREGRQILPTRFSWKFEIWPSFALDRTVVFEDALGLPRLVDLATTNGQPVFQYRVSESTNLLGWEFPLEFQIVQYRPQYWQRSAPYFRTNAWVVDWTLTGKVTAFAVGTEPQIPPELMSAAEKMKSDGANNRTQRTPR
jgi:hypothetical protein